MPPHTPPQSPTRRREASTVSRSRFFNAFNTREPGETVQNVIKRLNFNYSNFTFDPHTCERWLRLHRFIGSVAIYRPGKSHKKPLKITDQYLDILLNTLPEIQS